MQTLSRRGLFAVGAAGAAGTALAACGAEDDRRSEGADPDLLAAALAAENALTNTLSRTVRDTPIADTIAINQARVASAERAQELEELGAESSESAAAADPIEAAQAAIAAYREAAGLLSNPDGRVTMANFLAQVAAELAALRIEAGDEPVPFAFVTGGDEEPYEVPEQDEEDEE